MLDKLSQEGNALNVTTIVKPPKKIKSGDIINRALYATVVLLLIGIASTFFVKEMPAPVFDISSLAIDALWVIIASYTVGELFKMIFINKARATDEYTKAKEEAKNALNSLTSFELEHRGEYCKAYSEEMYNRNLKRLLLNIDVSEKEYMEKYHLLSYRELKAKYEQELPKRKIRELANINNLKRYDYDPDFFSVTFDTTGNLVPSQMFDEAKENRKNRITTAITSTISGFLSVSYAGRFLFDFSPSVLFMAIVKLTVVIIFASLKANFGWKLTMTTGINKYLLQVREVKNLQHYCSKIEQGEKQ